MKKWLAAVLTLVVVLGMTAGAGANTVQIIPLGVPIKDFIARYNGGISGLSPLDAAALQSDPDTGFSYFRIPDEAVIVLSIAGGKISLAQVVLEPTPSPGWETYLAVLDRCLMALAPELSEYDRHELAMQAVLSGVSKGETSVGAKNDYTVKDYTVQTIIGENNERRAIIFKF